MGSGWGGDNRIRLSPMRIILLELLLGFGSLVVSPVLLTGVPWSGGCIAKDPFVLWIKGMQESREWKGEMNRAQSAPPETDRRE